jgi:hypothetical protein
MYRRTTHFEFLLNEGEFRLSKKCYDADLRRTINHDNALIHEDNPRNRRRRICRKPRLQGAVPCRLPAGDVRQPRTRPREGGQMGTAGTRRPAKRQRPRPDSRAQGARTIPRLAAGATAPRYLPRCLSKKRAISVKISRVFPTAVGGLAKSRRTRAQRYVRSCRLLLDDAEPVQSRQHAFEVIARRAVPAYSWIRSFC